MTKRLERDVHVYPARKTKPHPAAWEISCDHPHVVAYCPTQRMATALGKALAKLSKAELVVHGKDGTIRRKDSFGNDPCPPKG